ncbi:MAG: TonB-dependent receptor [Pseudomonadota bacterium]
MAGVLSALFVVTASPLTLAQEALRLEEVVVTAQKRTESLQDVPIAVSVVSGEQLESADLRSLQSLAEYVPNFYQVATPTSNVVYIRGIGSGTNAGFEQSVGTFLDGSYLGRARQTLAPMFDLERVEVLKGPQSILFGKNTVAGAVSITSNRPDYETSARALAQYGTEEEWQIQGHVNGPLGDSVAARLSVYGAGIDGWVENEFDGADGPDTEDLALRLGITFDPSDTLSGYFKYQWSERTQTNAPYEIFQKSQQLDPATGQLVPQHLTDIDARQNYKTDFGNSGALGDNTTETELVMDNVLLQLDFSLGEHTLSSITGYTDYDYDTQSDLDFTAANLINVRPGGFENFDQLSQELRLVSPVGERFDYIAGLYWQKANVDIDQDIGFQLSTLVPAAGLVGADGYRETVFEQEAETWSGFFQGNVYLSPAWSVKFGLRYTYEEKTLDRLMGVRDFNDQLMNPVALASVWRDRLNTVPYNVRRERDEDDWTPMLALEWRATDDIMTYVSASKGFKGGGYDSTHSNGADIDALEYEPESAVSLEVGSKMTLADGRGSLNIAIFQTEFEDLQVSTFDGFVGFAVTNAAEATSRGVELDGRFLVTADLALSASLAWLDYEYDEYEGAPCTNSQLGQQIVDTGGSAGCVNDLSGQTINYAPEWSAAISGTWTLHPSESLDVDLTLDANYRDDFFMSADLDENTVQDAYWRINARIALVSSDGRWELALIGKNLTDEATYSASTIIPFGSSNTPAFNIPDFEGTYFGIVDRPRSVAVQFSYSLW